VKARSFASGSPKSRSIASAPISPVLRRYGRLTRRMVRLEQLDTGDGLQLARALVQHQLDMRKRLEARAEARLRLPHPFRDRADAPALARVEVKDPVGLGRSAASATRSPRSCTCLAWPYGPV